RERIQARFARRGCAAEAAECRVPSCFEAAAEVRLRHDRAHALERREALLQDGRLGFTLRREDLPGPVAAEEVALEAEREVVCRDFRRRLAVEGQESSQLERSVRIVGAR